MELLTSQLLHSDITVSGKEEQPMDASGEVESNDHDYIIISDSGSDSDSSLDSDFGGHLNQEQTSSIIVSGEDYASDSFDSDIPLSKRRKMDSSKKRKTSSLNNGELHDVNVHGYADNNLMIQQQSASLDVIKIEKKKNVKKAKDKDSPPLLWELWEEEHTRFIDENILEDVKLDDQSDTMNETAEASSDLILPLLRYQKEWLFWALKQENSETRGGILADEMGMGKTIQAIALVLAKRELHQMSCEPDESTPSPSSGSSKVLPVIKGTLVICPVVAVTQWVNEIDRFTSKGSTKVLVYHGPKRWKSVQQFAEYDFVITTYSTVEAEFRKYMMPPKEKCPYCGKSFVQSKLNSHLMYYCGPDAVKTEKQSKQVKKKIKEVTEGKMKESVSDKVSKGWNKESEDVSSQEMSLLHAVKWQRIILDEAHCIKSRHSNTAKAVLAVESSYKWALSGTPIQNRVGELYSLIRFLQIVPYSYYLCKDCDCRTLNHSSTQCLNCNHSSVRHFCWWNKYIATPIQSYGNGIFGKRAMILLKDRILKNIILRRTKIGRAADLALPPRIVSLRRDCLDVKEQDYYESLYSESQAQFNTYIEANTVMNNYAHIFVLLTRLRQAVDHPYLVVYSPTAKSRGGNMANNNAPTEPVCDICHQAAEDPVVTSCEHVFCKACLIDFSASLGQVSCPSCSQLFNVDFTSNKDVEDRAKKTTIKGFGPSSILNRIQLENFQTSTKIEALREEITLMIERDGSAKGIVFSQYTSFLDLINYSLNKSGLSCVQLNGAMTLAARDAAIKRFTDDPDCRIFLMSLKAGGVALNLTVASHVFLMDPWWNPAVERQAQDRIHRIGQFKPIRIVRFVIENTIEERILQLQEKKELVFDGTIGGSSEALAKLTEADLKFLFVT
ncbi:hypothetical protein RIF29_27418 [Crotalaria pallida]|uniref:DNA repair protein RAD16 n=1 Tax=Crotalaria pallida TaxID=3830 RepID=A0AAN9I107_CROPI